MITVVGFFLGFFVGGSLASGRYGYASDMIIGGFIGSMIGAVSGAMVDGYLI